jgi:hypothetical protein
MKRALLIVVVALLSVALVVPATASAHMSPSRWHRTIHDPRGDGAARLDITRVKAVLASHLVVTINVRNLKKSKPTNYWIQDGELFLETRVTRTGKIRTVLMTETVDALRCNGIHARWNFMANTIRVVTPRTCKGNTWKHHLEIFPSGGLDYVSFKLVRG